MQVKIFTTGKLYETRNAKSNDIRESLLAATALRKLGFPDITPITKLSKHITDICVHHNRKLHYVLFASEDNAITGLATLKNSGLDCLFKPGSTARFVPSVNYPDLKSPYGSAKTGYKSERGSW